MARGGARAGIIVIGETLGNELRVVVGHAAEIVRIPVARRWVVERSAGMGAERVLQSARRQRGSRMPIRRWAVRRAFEEPRAPAAGARRAPPRGSSRSDASGPRSPPARSPRLVPRRPRAHTAAVAAPRHHNPGDPGRTPGSPRPTPRSSSGTRKTTPPHKHHGPAEQAVPRLGPPPGTTASIPASNIVAPRRLPAARAPDLFNLRFKPLALRRSQPRPFQRS